MAKISYDKLKEIVREEVRAVVAEAFGYGNVKPEDAKEFGSSEGIGNSKKNADWTKGTPKGSKKNIDKPIGKKEEISGASVAERKPKEKIKFAVSKKKEIKDPGFK